MRPFTLTSKRWTCDMRVLNFVCTALPGPNGECQFVELENENGESVDVGEWQERPDGLVELSVNLEHVFSKDGE